MHPAQKIERYRLIIAKLQIMGFLRHGGGEMRQCGLMLAQSGIDAADRIKAQRILGQGHFGLAQDLRRLAIPPQQAEQFGQLSAIFAARLDCHRLLQMRQRLARPPGPSPAAAPAANRPAAKPAAQPRPDPSANPLPAAFEGRI
ncbi:hypothetical protein E4T56_gene3969 [Termitomyces sp. T112]|nr:hypothetical protein E4T56_gene3969 [Termitomyces sp. T112]